MFRSLVRYRSREHARRESVHASGGLAVVRHRACWCVLVLCFVSLRTLFGIHIKLNWDTYEMNAFNRDRSAGGPIGALKLGG